MNRTAVALVALFLASAARAQEQQESPQQEPAVDVTALEGRVASVEEQLAEAKTSLASLSRIKWSGYIQARYAWQEAVDYEGQESSFSDPDRTNFFIRRGRLKVVYDADLAQFVLQLDAIPNGVSVKEAYASVKLPVVGGIRGLAVDAGLQLFPFGYDVGVRSSSDLDLLERYRGAGYWLKGEYDLGVTLRGAYGPLNLRAGVFNGNGVDGTPAGQVGRDNDPLKDFIGRLGFDFGIVTGGVSGWWGKTRDFRANPSKTYDRNRVGADLQIYLDLLPLGGTALKGEYITGKTGIGVTADAGTPPVPVPPSLAGADAAVAGHAWHVTLVQNLGDTFQLAARYESFVRNDNLASATPRVKEITQLDVAVHAYIGGNYKLSALYSHPLDGETIGTGTGDPAGSVKETDQFIAQAQAKF
jgi:hypothetical protein